jgi:kojibiose phosphorylase
VPSPAPSEPAGWLVTEDELDVAGLRAAETVFTVGNGRFATRGSFEEGYPDARPATLMHGIFGAHPIAVSELANLPDWTALDIAIGTDPFSLASGTVLAYRRTLDLRTGILARDVTWRSPGGITARLVFERFASRERDDLAATRVAITLPDSTAAVTVRAKLAASATTRGLRHLEPGAQHADEATASLGVSIRETTTSVAMAARLAVHGSTTVAREAADLPAAPTLIARWTAAPDETVTAEKLVAVTSSRHADDPRLAAMDLIGSLEGATFDDLHAASAEAWARDWEASDVVIDGDEEAQLATRFSIYHLLIAAPRDDEQVSIGAKTLSGFGYHGHVFWDTEAFMLPFFIHVHPHIARNFLSYRYHRLGAARGKAQAGGFDGAQIPWESADSGDEVTPRWTPDVAPDGHPIRIWTGDIEIHVSAVVANAVMAYWAATGDDAFMLERGAQIILETARFWASRAEWNGKADRFEITDVIGPDEYHEHVDNNAFTNHLVAWHLRTAADLATWLLAGHPDHAARLAASADRIARFRHVADRMHVPRDPANGLVEQFDGYFALEDVDLSAHAGRTRSMQALLGMEGVGRTQVIKQPDVLMLAYLLPDLLSPDELAANYAYYTPRTDHEHGSSLGPAMQALVAARTGDIEEAYVHFMRAARADLADVRGNTADGIHGASAGGMWQALVFGFAGVRFDGADVVTDPHLPAHWTRLAFRLVRHGRTVEVDLHQPPAAEAAP